MSILYDSRNFNSNKNARPKARVLVETSRRYRVVFVVSVSVRLAVPSGVSTRVVERDLSVVSTGLLASIVTFAGGWTMVVVELGGCGVWTMVVVGSF